MIRGSIKDIKEMKGNYWAQFYTNKLENMGKRESTLESILEILNGPVCYT